MTERSEFQSVATPSRDDFTQEFNSKPTTGILPPSLPSERDITSPNKSQSLNGSTIPTSITSTTNGTESPAPEVPGAFRELAEQGAPATPLENVPEVAGAVEYVRQNLPSKEDVQTTMGNLSDGMSSVVGKVLAYLPGSYTTEEDDTNTSSFVPPTTTTSHTDSDIEHISNKMADLSTVPTTTVGDEDRPIAGSQFIHADTVTSENTGVVDKVTNAGQGMLEGAKGFVESWGMEGVARSVAGEKTGHVDDTNDSVGVALGTDTYASEATRESLRSTSNKLSDLATVPLASQTAAESKPLSLSHPTLGATSYPDPSTVKNAFANESTSDVMASSGLHPLVSGERDAAGLQETDVVNKSERERESMTLGTEMSTGRGLPPVPEEKINANTGMGVDMGLGVPEPGLEPGASGVAPTAPLGLQSQDEKDDSRTHSRPINSSANESESTQGPLVETPFGLAHEKPKSKATTSTTKIDATGSQGLNAQPTQEHTSRGGEAVNNALNPEHDQNSSLTRGAPSPLDEDEDSNPTSSSGSTKQIDEHEDNNDDKENGNDQTIAHKSPTMMSKIKGEVKILSGKLRKDSKKVEEGRSLKAGGAAGVGSV